MHAPAAALQKTFEPTNPDLEDLASYLMDIIKGTNKIHARMYKGVWWV